MDIIVVALRLTLQDHLPEIGAFCVVAVGAAARGIVGFLIGAAIFLAMGIASAVFAFACRVLDLCLAIDNRRVVQLQVILTDTSGLTLVCHRS